MTSGMTRAGSAAEPEQAVLDEAAPPSTAAQLPALLGRQTDSLLAPVAIGVLTAFWLGLAGWGFAVATAGRALNPAIAVSWLSVALAPLGLPAIAWLAWARRPQRMRRLQEGTAAALRRDAIILDHLLGRLAARSADAQAQLARQAELLRSVGEETGRRIHAVGDVLREGSSLLARQAGALDDAAATARSDLGVLIADLPEAESRVQSLILRVQALGGEIGGQAAALATRVGSLDEQQQALRGAAGELVRALDTARARGQALAGELIGAAEALEQHVGSAADLAADGMDKLRAGSAAQAGALAALVENTRAALDATGAEALDQLQRRAAACLSGAEGIQRALAGGSDAAHQLSADLTATLAELETRQVALGEAGMTRTRALQQALGEAGGEIERLVALIGASDLASGAAISRAAELHQELDRAAATLSTTLPPLLLRSAEGAGTISAEVDHAAGGLQAFADALPAQHQAVLDLNTSGEAMATRLGDGLGRAHEQLETLVATTAALAETIGRADADAARFVEGAGPQLLDALVRVRDAAVQVAERARGALGEVVTPIAERLRIEAEGALERAVEAAVSNPEAAVASAAERAMAAASAATAELEERLRSLDAALVRADARISDGIARAEEAGDNSFSRRMALLVESLNSTAIDVAKLLSNEVTDTAWAAYLKGDRGVFARRSVRLLETGEAREIVRHYEVDPEFRAQVDRYVHDFEAMLRDALAFRPGTPLGVTLLSSDVGKLYVALAQAIERLRA